MNSFLHLSVNGGRECGSWLFIESFPVYSSSPLSGNILLPDSDWPRTSFVGGQQSITFPRFLHPVAEREDIPWYDAL
jgi:hypothetical protein